MCLYQSQVTQSSIRALGHRDVGKLDSFVDLPTFQIYTSWNQLSERNASHRICEHGAKFVIVSLKILIPIQFLHYLVLNCLPAGRLHCDRKALAVGSQLLYDLKA